jgi:hypothetical protein
MAARGDRRRSYRPAQAEQTALTSPTAASPTSPASPAYPPLSPPRPFFISSRSQADRGSYSSADTSPDTGSDSEREAAPAPAPASPHARARNHHRRRSSMGAGGQYAAVGGDSPDVPVTPTTGDPFMTPRERDASGWSATDLYARGEREAREDPRGVKAPPSAYPFPFQVGPSSLFSLLFHLA